MPVVTVTYKLERGTQVVYCDGEGIMLLVKVEEIVSLGGGMPMLDLSNGQKAVPHLGNIPGALNYYWTFSGRRDERTA